MTQSLYIHDMDGIFPESANLEEFWELLIQRKKTKAESLAHYWGLDPETYRHQVDGKIQQDLAHLAKYRPQDKTFPRQIQGAIDIGLRLKNRLPPDSQMLRTGLVIACEWTDDSFYKAQLNIIPAHLGYALDRQVKVIQKSLGIEGPALAVDTACASSLYALELARGILQQGCDQVIVLGLNLSLHSFLYRGFTKLGALSLKGELNSFDKNADGIVLGEAVCGITLSLKPHNALAQIAGIGLSSDGSEGSAFSPGFFGQLHAYERAYQQSKISPDQVDYVEAHGTATILGDETECRSLHQFFKPSPHKKLTIGSLKANIGHTLAASGLASLIKSVLMIKHKVLLPHISITEREDLSRLNLSILDTPKKIQKDSMVIGISSFGFGGSNAHIILTSELTEKSQQKPKADATFYVQNFIPLNAQSLNQAPPVIKNVGMGPRMQERIDPLQRWAMHLTQELISNSEEAEKRNMSCIAVNNLGGQLSVEFEKKYHLNLTHPELSIEAIASTLPSMMSGHPSILFNFQGHHMTLSGDEGCFISALKLIPELLAQAQGEIILLIAHRSVEKPEKAFMLGLRLRQMQNTNSIAKITLGASQTTGHPRELGEATGAFEFYQFLETKELHLNLRDLKLEKTLLKSGPSELMQDLIAQSKLNKQIALDYLNLLMFLKIDHTHEEKLGRFLEKCQKTTHSASATLVVDETEKYFFDHPLDHIPGILPIHGCEELLRWFMDSPYLIQTMTIRFTKFLEKNKPVLISLTQRESGSIEFEINQDKVRAGILKVDVKALPHFSSFSPKLDQIFTRENQKLTHKHREENVLVSTLDLESQTVWTLPLSEERGPFFNGLTTPSTLYFAEVTRQFVMLLAHLVKKIPLSSKMNLIATEINLAQWVKPPFQMKLQNFKLTETEDFLVADVIVDFMLEERVFGQGKIKAQVVSPDYYHLQRGEK